MSSTIITAFVLVIAFNLFPHSLSGQYAIITGTVQDNYDSSPISGVHISYQNALNGVTSNSDGNFQLRIDNVSLVDSITFSHIGYEPKSFLISDLLKYDLVVNLTAAIYETPNVVITQLSGEQLISRALGNVEKHFHNEDHYVGGFYREKTVHVGKSELIYLAEGELNVHKSKYQNHPRHHLPSEWKAPRDQVQLVQGEIVKESKSYVAYNMLQPIPEITNGPTVAVSLDFYKSSRAFLSEKEFKNYDYKLHGYEQIGGTNYYLISFEPKKDNFLTRGIFYYDADKEIITSVKYYFTEEGIKAYNKQNLIDLASRSFEVSYRLRGGKYTLDRVLVENVFSHKVLGDQIYNELEFITTSVKTEDVLPILRAKELNQGHDLNHFIKLGLKPNWGQISLIPREKQISAMLLPKRKKIQVPSLDIDSSEINFYDIQKNYQLAMENDKISLIIASASWCPPCKKLKREVFHNEETVKFLNKHFYVTILDYDAPVDKAYLTKYDINRIPYTLALQNTGKELGRIDGYSSLGNFYNNIKYFVKKDQKLNASQNHKLWEDVNRLQQSYSEKEKKQKKRERNVFKQIKKKKLTSEEIAFVLYTAEIHDFEGRRFKYLMKYKDDYISYFGPKQYTDKLLETIITHHYYQALKYKYLKGRIDTTQLSKLITKHMPSYYDIVYSRYMAEHHQYVTLDQASSNASWLKYFDAIPTDHFASYDTDLYNFISQTTEAGVLQELKAIILKHNIDSPSIKDHIMQIDFLIKGDDAIPRPKVMIEETDRSYISRY